MAQTQIRAPDQPQPQALLRLDLTAAAFKRDPFALGRQLRAAGDVVRIKVPFLGPVWLAVSYTAVSEVMKKPDRFVMEPANAGRSYPAWLKWWMPSTIRILADNMLLKDDPDHRRLRRLVDQAFRRQDIDRLRGRIAAIAADLVAPAAESGRMELVADLARPLPLFVIAEMLGLPETDRQRFISLAGAMVNIATPLGFARAMPRMKKLADYLTGEIAACRRAPREGLMSALVEARDEGEALTERELLAMVFLLLMAGHETTTHLISVGMLTLLQHPEQRAILKADGSLMPRAADELLRHVSPVQLTKPRHVAEDMTFHGAELRKGELIMASISSANADPTRFPEPERLQLDRHPNPHLAFGSGPHVCLGQQLARAEAEIAFAMLLERFPGMRLSVDESRLTWGRSGMRALAALPVNVRG